MLFAAGDLYAGWEQPGVEAEEGIQTQQRVQRERREQFPDYASEVSLRLSFPICSSPWLIRGRADGVYSEGQTLIVEEFKTCRLLPARADPVDLGQALLYAGGFASQGMDARYEEFASLLAEPTSPVLVRLVYVHADTLEERVFEHQSSVAALQAQLAFTLLVLQARWTKHLDRVAARMAWAQTLEFPMPSFRPGQQAIARRIYRAIRQQEQLLLEAPTGSGKSLAVLYPGIRAAEEDTQLFFLTSRNAGSEAALEAAQKLAGEGRTLSAIELTAKEKICPVEGMPCNPEQCPYASGYFERIAPAVDELLSLGVVATAQVSQVAEKFTVCPFELSLDAAVWADLIIGDYNYIFDPVVRLQRLAGHKGLHLLVDEAHQLGPRVQNMLAVELDRDCLRAACQNAPATVLKRLKSVDRALLKLRRLGDGQHELEELNSLDRAVTRLLDTVAEEALDLSEHEQLRPFYLQAHRWQRAQQWIVAEVFACLATVDGRQVSASRVCLDIGPWLNGVLKEHGACIRFSATLTPLPVYQRIHGQTEGEAERAASPFDPARLKILIINDVPTYFRSRTASLPKLVQTIAAVAETRTGHYLVALPSFSYLEQVYQAMADARLCAVQFRQQPGMNARETAQLIAEFAAAEQGMMFVVLGGMLGESVNFTGVRLSGVFIVGLGLPPPSLPRDLMARYFDQQESRGWGQRIAYTQPALSKIQQAAGRLIRDDEDRGVVCLIDPRFTNTEIRHFQPAHWHPVVTDAAAAVGQARQFWRDDTQADN